METSSSSGPERAVPKQHRLRRNSGWNLVGLVVYSLSQWLFIAALAGDSPKAAGEFALAMAVVTPLFMFLSLNLRLVQAVEDDDSVWWSHVVIRMGGLAVGLPFAALGALVLDLPVSLLVVLGAARWLESLSNMTYGTFLAKRDLRPLGVGMMARGIVGAGLAHVSWTASSSLLTASAALAVGWGSVLAAYELPQAVGRMRITRQVSRKETMRLVRRGIPLGLDSAANSMIHQVPRFFIASLLGTAALGRYVPVVQLAQYATVLAGSVGAALMSSLAALHRQERFAEFRALIVKVAAASVPFSLVLLAVAGFAGPPLVGVVLGSDFVDRPLIWGTGMLTAVISTERLLARGLQATGRFVSVLFVDLSILAVTVVASVALIHWIGAAGGALAMTLGFFAGLVAVVVLLAKVSGSDTSQKLRGVVL